MSPQQQQELQEQKEREIDSFIELYGTHLPTKFELGCEVMKRDIGKIARYIGRSISTFAYIMSTLLVHGTHVPLHHSRAHVREI